MPATWNSARWCAPGWRPAAATASLPRLEVCDFNSDAGKSQHVVLTDEGAAFFRRHCAGRSGHELMFRHDDGGAWQRSEQARPMAEACTNGNIRPAISFHILRHTWAERGVPGGVIARPPAAVVTRWLF